jgi:hypothetical protein
MIEVFKTDIQETEAANSIIALLLQRFPGTRVNIDLHDCDKVLRVEGSYFLPAAIVQLVNDNGFLCGILE